MKSFNAAIDIDAAPEAVWAVLVDVAHWPQFDSYTARMEGQAALNATASKPRSSRRTTKITKKKIQILLRVLRGLRALRGFRRGYRSWLEVLVAPPGRRNAMYSPEYTPPATATMMYCLPSAR